jgi:hypothetical protein
VLAAQAQDLHTALRRVADDGWSYVILDGKLFDCDRLTETTLSVKGETIDAWYSGKHRDSGRMTAFLDQGAAQARPAALGGSGRASGMAMATSVVAGTWPRQAVLA